MTAPMSPRPPAPPVRAAGPGERTLLDCELVIDRGLATFVEVGRALAEIRDRRLYRLTHGTFEDYCQQRWGFNDSRARQLIAAADVAREIETVTTVTITSERQARALGPVIRQLGPEAAAEILAEQAATGRVTASGITEAARRRADDHDPALDPAAQAVDEFIHADGSVRRANLIADFSRWMANIGKAHLFDVQEMAAIAGDPDHRESAERIHRTLSDWFGAYLAATAPKPGLRIVGGGDR